MYLHVARSRVPTQTQDIDRIKGISETIFFFEDVSIDLAITIVHGSSCAGRSSPCDLSKITCKYISPGHACSLFQLRDIEYHAKETVIYNRFGTVKRALIAVHLALIR